MTHLVTPLNATPSLEQERAVPVAIENLRVEHRFAVDQRVWVTLVGAGQSRLAAYVRNVSRKGMSLELEACLLSAGGAVKVEWGNRVLLGHVRHLTQKGGATILGVELSSTWESFLEEILAQHAQAVAQTQSDLQSLTSLASREMQETLAVAALYMDLLAKGAERTGDPETQRLVACAQEATAHIREVIQEMTTYAHMITEPLNMAAVDSDRLVSGLARQLGTGEQAAVTHDRLPIVMGDSKELRLVFHHLIAHVLKSRRQEKPRVHVSARYKAGEWIFSVAGRGAGPEARPNGRLFRLLDPGEFAGSGLGVILARRIIEKHGGRMWTESEPDENASLSFVLPSRPKPWE